MKIPFFWISLGLITGILAGPLLAIPKQIQLLTLLGSLPLLWILRGSRYYLSFFVLCLILLGSVHSSGSAPTKDSSAGYFASGNRKVNLVGRIETSPELKTQGKKKTLSFVFRPSILTRKKNGRYEKFRFRDKVQVFVHQPEMIPKLGQKVRLWGHLEIPKPVMNPGQFNYAIF